jgi:Tfp pilus assembly protein PilF
VAERKDVLSAVFFMLTLLAYVRYARAPSTWRYLIVAFVFALGLMSKPMVVTLPFVLLLLDYWPLNRVGGERSRARRQLLRLLVEKLPLIALSAFSCVATLLAQKHDPGAIDQLPFMWRLNNAFVSCVTYVSQMFWPARLAVFYPHPNNRLALWQVILAIAFLVTTTTVAISLRQKKPYLLTGWLWYLGMLVPVIGLIQVGEQGHADRYTYLPHIGLYILITWSIAEVIPQFRQGARRRVLFASAAITTITVLSWCAFAQTSHWKNSERLWTHALVVTSNNDVAHNNLGFLFLRQGELDKAISQFHTALNIRSENHQTHYDLGAALIHNNLGNALARKLIADEAIAHFQDAIRLRPDYADAYYNLGSVLFQRGQVDQAIAEWQKAVEIQPRDAEAHRSLASAFLKNEEAKLAIVEYERALEITPDDGLALNNLAWILATSSDVSTRDGAKAVVLARQAVQLSTGRDSKSLRTLAAACAEAGRFSDAIATAKQAREIAIEQNKLGLANSLEKEIGLYAAHAPLREAESSK